MMKMIRILCLIAGLFVYGLADQVIPSAYSVSPSDPMYLKKPYVNGAKFFHGGIIHEYNGKTIDITSPIYNQKTNERTIIGKLAQMNEDDIPIILDSAKKAWNNGRGIWPQMSPNERILALENIVISLKERRDEIINVLMWEICKSSDDAAAEFDRTMIFIESTIAAFRELDKIEGNWKTINGIIAKFRRTAIGIMLCLGPFNYPFNETYATLIPALLTGNIIIMKIPNLGGLAHILTMEVYAKHLPPGTINFFSGSGKKTMSPIMKTGLIDILAFIGSSKAADSIIKSHPYPHRLKVFLQLEGKNLGIVMSDADINTAVEQITIGSTNYNGQRCTAIKLIMLHKSIVNQFLEKFIISINKLKFGLPWSKNVQITPLAEPEKPKYLLNTITDAVIHGGAVLNVLEGGGHLHGSLMRPAIVYPVNNKMKLWSEEQFGPVIPIAVYENNQDIYDYIANSTYGQQISIFTTNSQESSQESSSSSQESSSSSQESSSELIDILSTNIGRININTQCSRSPDILPFTGRKSSSLGTMSITDAIKQFSIETVIAGKSNTLNNELMYGYERTTKFLQPLTYLNNKKEEL